MKTSPLVVLSALFCLQGPVRASCYFWKGRITQAGNCRGRLSSIGQSIVPLYYSLVQGLSWKRAHLCSLCFVFKCKRAFHNGCRMEQNITESSALSGGANHDVEEAHGDTKSESDVSSDKINFEDEVRRLENDAMIVVEGLSESVVYRNIIFKLKNDPGISSNIARVLGSEKHMPMVVYALGSMETWYWSQQQLALAILLKRDFNWIGEIQVFDPLISPVDRKVLEDMGCVALSVNENCRRQVTKPTIFFMPFAEFRLKKNLLEANILPSQLNQMVILSDHEIYELDTEPRSFDQAVYMAYRIAVKKFTSFFQLNPSSNNSKTDFGSFHWRFFNISDHFEIKKEVPASLIEELKLKYKHICSTDDSPNYEDLRQWTEKTLDFIFSNNETEDGNYFRGSRLPLKFRCMGLPPCAGWIKLNFSGRGYDGHTPAGFGGIFHDQFNDCIGSYHGSLGEANAIVAGAEALREGIRCIQRICPVRRLIIEGDELRVILWLNEVLLYPSMIKVQMLEVFDFLKNKVFVVGHIHEEAN